MSNRVYIDAEQFHAHNGACGFLISDEDGQPCEIMYTGKTIASMPVAGRRERAYQILDREYDVRFIFDDAIPDFHFYPVPRLDIFATDSQGGCFACLNHAADLEEPNAPICYVDAQRRHHDLAPNLKAFLQLIVFEPRWRERRGLARADFPVTREGAAYLIRTLQLTKNPVNGFSPTQPTVDLTIYASMEEARAEIEFYDVSDLIARMESHGNV